MSAEQYADSVRCDCGHEELTDPWEECFHLGACPLGEKLRTEWRITRQRLFDGKACE